MTRTAPGLTIQTAGTVAEVRIIGRIPVHGARLLIERLESTAARDVAEIHVCIDSLGGDWLGGLSIANYLIGHPARVTTTTLAVAGSAASVIAQAGDQVVMHENSFFYLHLPWVGAPSLNRRDLDEVKALLEKTEATLIGLYQRHSGLDSGQLRALMEADSWIQAPRAHELRLCHRVISASVAAPSSAVGSDVALEIPEIVAAAWRAPAPPELQPAHQCERCGVIYRGIAACAFGGEHLPVAGSDSVRLGQLLADPVAAAQAAAAHRLKVLGL